MTDKTLEQLTQELSSWTTRVKCKQEEVKEYLIELSKIIGPGIVAVIEQKIHDMGFLGAKEAALAEMVKVKAKEEADKKALEEALEAHT